MFTKKFAVIYTFILALLLAFSCMVFTACGENCEPVSQPEPVPEPGTSIFTKSFTFTPEFGGEYIFFDNIYFEELYVTTNGEEIYPSVDGEYRLTSRTTYVISFKGCKELSYELTYDISDDREVALAPGEEYIVKLGKIYDEVKTITTGNDNIKITGIYTGTPNDLEEYEYSPSVKMPSYTLLLFCGEYYVVLLNDGTEEEDVEISLEDIDVVTFDAEGNTSYAFGANGDIYVRLQNIPYGHYKITVPATEGGIRYAVYDEDLDRLSGGNIGANEAYFSAFGDAVYLHLEITGTIDESPENMINIEKVEDEYQWVINGEPLYTNAVELAQGDSLEFGLIVNGVTTNIEITDVDMGAIYGASVDGNVVTLAKDGSVDGGFFDIFIVINSAVYLDLPRFRITPVLAEPFAGVTFETANGKTVMSWENVPNLYSFAYSVNGGTPVTVTTVEITSADITSLLPLGHRRALVKITDVTYSYPEYDAEGSLTGEMRKVTHDDVMKYVVEY